MKLCICSQTYKNTKKFYIFTFLQLNKVLEGACLVGVISDFSWWGRKPVLEPAIVKLWSQLALDQTWPLSKDKIWTWLDLTRLWSDIGNSRDAFVNFAESVSHSKTTLALAAQVNSVVLLSLAPRHLMRWHQQPPRL